MLLAKNTLPQEIEDQSDVMPVDVWLWGYRIPQAGVKLFTFEEPDTLKDKAQFHLAEPPGTRYARPVHYSK